MTVHYVRFLFPGSLFPEERTQRLESRTAVIDVPANCFAYEFFDREEVEAGGETLVGSPKNQSGRTYFGEVLTLDDVKRLPGDYGTLISNMECNGWAKVVRTRRGNFQPLNENDRVVTA